MGPFNDPYEVPSLVVITALDCVYTSSDERITGRRIQNIRIGGRWLFYLMMLRIGRGLAAYGSALFTATHRAINRILSQVSRRHGWLWMKS